MNQYKELKDSHQERFSQFPIMFAFSNEQFEEGMKQLGLNREDIDQICCIGGGGYIRKTDGELLDELFAQFKQEIQDAIDADPTGEGFVKDMFSYELANHEYGYTYEIDDALRALGLTYEEIANSEKLSYGLKMAQDEYRD